LAKFKSKVENQIKILHIINDLGVGGAQRVVADIVKHIDPKKYDSSILNLNFINDNTIEKELKYSGFQVANVYPFSKFDVRCIRWIYNFIMQEKISIVHTHLAVASIYGKIAAKLSKVPGVVSTEHNTSSLLTKPWYYRSALRLSYQLNSKVSVISENVRKLVIQKGKVPPEKVELIYNGIDFDKFNPEKHLNCQNIAAEKIFQGNPIIGSVGRLEPRKGYRYLIEAFQKVKCSEKNAQLIIVGSGKPEDLPIDDRLRDSITLISAFDDIPFFLSRIDLFVLPSIEEGLGIAILEAMAMKKPVIATKVGGIPEIIKDGENGVLVPSCDSHALAKAILDTWRDPDQRKKYEEEGQNLVIKKFDLKKTIAQVEKVYSDLASQNK
jgi:glycosyltransferase involved in cell wall biosynthesis